MRVVAASRPLPFPRARAHTRSSRVFRCSPPGFFRGGAWLYKTGHKMGSSPCSTVHSTDIPSNTWLSLSLALSLCLLYVPVNQYPLPLCILFIHIIHEPCSVSTRLSTSLINRKVGALQCITWKQKTGRRDPEPLHHGPLSQRPELLRNYVKL